MEGEVWATLDFNGSIASVGLHFFIISSLMRLRDSFLLSRSVEICFISCNTISNRSKYI